MLTSEKPMITTKATNVLNTIEWRVESCSLSERGMVESSVGRCLILRFVTSAGHGWGCTHNAFESV